MRMMMVSVMVRMMMRMRRRSEGGFINHGFGDNGDVGNGYRWHG